MTGRNQPSATLIPNSWRPVGSIALVLVLLAVPIAGYRELYADVGFLPTLLAGTVIGAVPGLCILHRDAATSTARSPAAFSSATAPKRTAWATAATVGGLLAVVTLWPLVRPDPRVGNPVRELSRGLQTLLTTNQPADIGNGTLALPYLVTGLAAVLTFLSLSTASSLLPVAPPLGALGVQSLLCAGAGAPLPSTAEGAGFALAGVGLLALRRHHGSEPLPMGHQERRIAVAIAVAAAALTAIGVNIEPGGDPKDPREHWAPAASQSAVTPLAWLRSELLDPANPARFTVIPATAGMDRMELARLNHFDGSAWTAAPQFRVAGSRLRSDDWAAAADGERATGDVVVTSLPDDLLPAPGEPVTLKRRDQPLRPGDLWFDTGTGMLRAGSIPAHWRYTIASTRPERETPGPAPDPGLCRPAAPLGAPTAWRLPPDPGPAAVAALAERMRRELPYNPQAAAGSSSGAILRLLAGTDPGSAEQHAAALSAVSCDAGRPARVVVGYRLPKGVEAGRAVVVSAHDIHAWSEVWFEGMGWRSFEPTDLAKPITAMPGGQKAAPGPTAPTPSATYTAPLIDAAPPPSGGRDWDLTRVMLLVAALLSGVLAMVSFLQLMDDQLRYRLQRRRQRRALKADIERWRRSPDPDQRLLAAWRITTWTLSERGAPIRPSWTPEEVAAHSAHSLQDPDDALPELVGLVNATLFGPDPTLDGAADRAWELSRAVLAAPPERGRR